VPRALTQTRPTSYSPLKRVAAAPSGCNVLIRGLKTPPLAVLAKRSSPDRENEWFLATLNTPYVMPLNLATHSSLKFDAPDMPLFLRFGR